MRARRLFFLSVLYHGNREVVSRLPECPTGPLHRTTYAAVGRRCKQLANALLKEVGVAQGTVVGTLAFNTFRHFEAYYGVSGIGAILHTVNPKLFLEQIEYIVNHGEDDVLMVDMGCVPVLLQLLGRGNVSTKKIIIMTEERYMPKDPLLAAGGRTVWCYETLLARHSDQLVWPIFDENTASSLCYTSGTTGQNRQQQPPAHHRMHKEAQPPAHNRMHKGSTILISSPSLFRCCPSLQATRRASSTRTAAPSCTRTPSLSRTRSRSALRTPSSRSCRCFT